VSRCTKLGKICGNLLQIFELKKVFDPDDVHGNDGPPTAGKANTLDETQQIQHCANTENKTKMRVNGTE
jgi:hypothetical protein